MHDIGGTLDEFGMENNPEMQESTFEFESLSEFGVTGEVSSPFNEVQEMELAAELSAVTNEAELNHFLGRLIRNAANVVGSAVRSPVGQALGGILKDAARKALPVVGSSIGGYLGGPAGAGLGGKLATAAGQKWLGLELEGLSPEDRDFEMAKQFVRYSGAAVSKAMQIPQNVQPYIAAQQAAAAAARRYLPGLIGSAMQTSVPASSMGRSGRWIRRGRKIILIGI